MLINLLKLFWIFSNRCFYLRWRLCDDSIIEEMVVHKYQYIDYELFMDMIAISNQHRDRLRLTWQRLLVLNRRSIRCIFATVGVVLPSYIIILIIASLGSRFLKNKYVKAAFFAIRPAAVALIIVAFWRFLKCNYSRSFFKRYFF